MSIGTCSEDSRLFQVMVGLLLTEITEDTNISLLKVFWGASCVITPVNSGAAQCRGTSQMWAEREAPGGIPALQAVACSPGPRCFFLDRFPHQTILSLSGVT